MNTRTNSVIKDPDGSLNVTAFLSKVYKLMAMSLLISFGTAILTTYLSKTLAIISASWPIAIGACVIEIGLMFAMYKCTDNATTERNLLIAFSVVDGFTLSCIFLIYSIQLIAYAFALAFIDFATTSFVGIHTKKNLSVLRQVMYGCLLAFIVVTFLGFILSIFTSFSFPILLFSWVGLIIFSIMTICDTNNLVQMAKAHIDSPCVAVLGAVDLYLDFINILLDLLEILSDGNNNN